MIKIKTPKEIELIREASKLAKEVLERSLELVKPGITTLEIDDFVREFTRSKGAKSAPFNYKGFPKSVCTSVNEVVCHGIPGPYVLQEGDIINIDVTPILGGYHGDTSATVGVGKISEEAQKLIRVTHACLEAGIMGIQIGGDINDIGRAIQTVIDNESTSYSIVEDYCGHGIGRGFHEEPAVCHYARNDKGPKIVEGMIFTIEPMINMGRKETELMADKWTVKTRDRSLSAQFEHTIAVTSRGIEVLTR